MEPETKIDLEDLPTEVAEALKEAGQLRLRATELANALDKEMETPEHEHVRGNLVRWLGLRVEELATSYAASVVAGQNLGTEYGKQIIRTEHQERRAAAAEEARDAYLKTIRHGARQIERLEAKLFRRAGVTGVLRAELARTEDELERTAAELERVRERLIGHLQAKGAMLKESRKAHRLAAEANVRLADDLATARRRLRDAHLRKLTLAFGEGGMRVDVGSKVAEPLDSETDRQLLEVIEGAIRRVAREARDFNTVQDLRALQSVAVLDALRNVGGSR